MRKIFAGLKEKTFFRWVKNFGPGQKIRQTFCRNWWRTSSNSRYIIKLYTKTPSHITPKLTTSITGSDSGTTVNSTLNNKQIIPMDKTTSKKSGTVGKILKKASHILVSHNIFHRFNNNWDHFKHRNDTWRNKDWVL